MLILFSLQIFGFFFFLWLISKLFERKLPLVYGHYTQINELYHIKCWLVYLYLRLFVKRQNLLPGCNLNGSKPTSVYEAGLIAGKEEEEIEFASDDGIEFLCSDLNGNSLIAGVDRDENNQSWFFIHLSSLQSFESTSKQLSAIGLQLQPIAPFRKWKLLFNGFLRKGTQVQLDDKNDQVITGKSKLIWTPSHQEILNNKDHRNDWLFSKAIARECWNLKFWNHFQKYQADEWCEQWGMLEGKLQLEGIDEEIHLLLRGKKRRLKRPSKPNNLYKKVVVDLYAADGTVVHFCSESFDTGLTENSFGYVVYCDEKYRELHDTNFSLAHFAENKIIPSTLNFILKTKDKKFDVKLNISPSTNFRLIAGVKQNEETFIHAVTATIDGYKASGFLKVIYPVRSPTVAIVPNTFQQLKEIKVTDPTLLAIPLTDVNCRDGDFVGGKAMSLGLMTTIQSNDFKIPPGFCITVSAYWKQLNANPKLPELIHHLQSTCNESNLSQLQMQCETVMKEISNTEVNSTIKQAVEVVLEKLFGQSFSDKRFAVRSSAVGEDGEETSSAGQNDTYLGVKGIDKIHEAISKCWASQFAFQAVQYRRQHGQLINCGMGVVIQEMVPSETAGVLFTREPVEGDISKILITASYGLGESVVSSLCDPDTIYVHRNWRDEVSILEKNVGQKKSMVTIDDSESGTKQAEIDEEHRISCCLTDEQVLNLAKIGIFNENIFGGPRDVEWAFSDGKLYLLQSRAITNLDRDDEWWIINEMNTAPIGDEDISSVANLRDVLPGALTPLTLSFSQAMLEIGLKSRRGHPTPSSSRFVNWRFFGVFGRNCLMNLTSIFNVGVNRKLSSQDIGIGHSVLGCNIYSGGLHEVLLHRYDEITAAGKLDTAFPAIKFLFRGGEEFHKTCAIAMPIIKEKLRFTDKDDANRIYNIICDDVAPYFQVLESHMDCSHSSSVVNGVITAFLTADAEEFTAVHLSDIAVLMSNCSDVVSADVPTAMQELVETIKELPEVTKKIYKDATANEFLDLLRNDTGLAGKKFRQFLEIHGHRAYKELELLAITWAKDPIPLINAIQTPLKSNVSNKVQKKEPLSIKETIDSLQTPLPKILKLVMRFILRKSREIVSIREHMKSNLSMVTDFYRKAFWALGERMVKEGRILDPEIIFYFTLYEIGQFLKSRSPRLLSLATQRQALHPRLEKIEFPAMVYGYPTLKLDTEEDIDYAIDREPGLILKATCASRGKCRGTARVIRHVSEANTIQSGDILITYSTDICWSPYFPLLSGVVTEIGGLISHGAVVAREYGLPCLIAAENATKLFRSGDQIILDASKGIIELIPNT